MLRNISTRVNNRGFLIVFGVIFLILTSYFYNRHALNIHFVDEEENIVLGSYILKGEKLYSDLFSQHQPLAYISSALIQKLTHPGSIFTLISRHRQPMILCSFIWGMFLAESLSVYPLAYLSFVFFYNKSINPKTLFLTSLVLGMLLSNLLFIWPLSLFLYVGIVFKIPQGVVKRNLKYIVAGVLPYLLQLPFISLSEYFFQVFYINVQYYIPTTGNFALFKSFFYPILLFDPRIAATQFLMILRILSFILVVGSFLLIKLRKKIDFLIVYVLLVLAALRFVPFGGEYYRGFHLLPWYGLLIFSIIIVCTKLLNSYSSLLPLFAIFVALPLSSATLTQNINKNERYYINYSRQFDYGEAVRIMRDNNDTLFVVPDEFLIYWQGDVEHAMDYLFYYDWMMKTPLIAEAVTAHIKETPPTFFYCDCMGKSANELTTGYFRLKKDGYPTKLYVLPQKVRRLNQVQLGQLKYYNFSF